MPATVAIIVEWENALLADLDRARQMLAQLNIQAPAYARDHNTRFELMIMYNPEDIDVSVPRTAVQGEIDESAWPGSVRYLEAPGLHYFEQKNFGAASTTADVLLFVDSDVIPEPGWMGHLLDAIDEEGAQMVVGRTYLAHERFFERLFAGFWIFEPRTDGRGLRRTQNFWSNNLAVRRSLFLDHRYPEATAYRGQGGVLAKSVRGAGHVIWEHGEAHVSHPAPEGFGIALIRAVCRGYDNMFWARYRRKGPLAASPVGACWRLLRESGRLLRRLPRRARALGLGLPTAITSAAFGVLYYGVAFLAECVCFVAPGFIRRRFQM